MSSDQLTTTELLHRLEEAQRVAHVGSFEWNIASNVVTWSDSAARPSEN